MSTHGHEEKNASHSQPADAKSDDSVAAPAKADRMRMMLKVVARYTVLSLAPLIAIAALAIAIVAFKSNRANLTQMTQSTEKIEALNAALLATKSDLDSLKLSALKTKSIQSEALAQQDERITKIIQNITPMQVKMKISPTLAQQLSQPASAVSATPPVVSAPPAPHETTPQVVTPPVIAPPVAKPHAATPAAPAPHVAATPVAAPHAPEKAAAPATPTTSVKAEKKISPQVRAMKDAIEQYNKKN
jgi:hypothetical protein